MMKKIFLMCIVCLTFATCTFAQKTTTRIQDTQARMLDMVSDGYVKPLTVELKINEAKGRIRDVWALTKEQAEVEMHGDIPNIRAYGVFMSSKKHNADVIVAATFNFRTAESGNGYELEVVGFPANFVNWRTMTNADLDWIQMEKTQTLQEKDKIKPLLKK